MNVQQKSSPHFTNFIKMTPTEKIEAVFRRRCSVMMLAFADGGFGSVEIPRLRVTDIVFSGCQWDEANIDDDKVSVGRNAACEIIVDLEVERSNLNWGGNLHGGCTAWLIDICTTLPIFCLQGNRRWSTSGVTTSLAVHYLAAAPVSCSDFFT